MVEIDILVRVSLFPSEHARLYVDLVYVIVRVEAEEVAEVAEVA